MHKIKNGKDIETERGPGQDRPIQRKDRRGICKGKNQGKENSGGAPLWHNKDVDGQVQPIAEREGKSPDRVRLLHCRL